MKSFREYLAEADYEYAGGTHLSQDELRNRARKFGFTNHGKQIPFTVPGVDGTYSFEHTVHAALLDPDFQGIDASKGDLDPRDPSQIQANIDNAIRDFQQTPNKHNAFRIANYKTMKQDAEQYQKIKNQLPKSGQSVSGDNTSQTVAPGQSGKTLLPVDPKVKELQDRILAKDPNALSKYGADGRMGPETRAAMARLGIKESLELQRILDIAKF